MITPNIPHQTTPMMNEDGTMHDSWHKFFSQLTDGLQNSASEEGLVPGSQSFEDILKLDGEDHMGRMIYDNTNNSMKINNSGKYKEIYTRPEELEPEEIANIPTSKINGTIVYDKTNKKLLYGVENTFKHIGLT